MSDAFQIECPSCHKQLKAKPELVGKSAKCPGCGNAVNIVRPSVVDAPPSSKRNLSDSPATQKQIEYAKSLGIQIEQNITRSEIGRLIDDAVAKRDEDRWRRLDHIQDRESKAYAEIREEILREIDEDDPRISTSDPQKIMEVFSQRNKAGILISIDADETEGFLSGESNAGVAISYTEDFLDEQECFRVLAMLGAKVIHNLK